MHARSPLSRREYLKSSLASAAAVLAAPTVLPASVFGRNAPSNRVNVAQIGAGRIARAHDLPETLKLDNVRLVAIADVDMKRAREGRDHVRDWYIRRTGRPAPADIAIYQDYRELLARADVDAVVISTPDHAHFLPAIEAAAAGKHIYLQKPNSLTIEEGRLMSDAIRKSGIVFQLGSQQRSDDPWPQFRRACELVRNGRIGQLHTIRIGLPGDPPGGDPTPMPVPENLDYDAWLGPTPYVYYTEDRVHPQEGYDRPGWLRCEQFTPGMITGWGSHHVDIAHWGMGTELTGPIEIEAEAEFPEVGLWNVHGDFRVEAKYANGVTMYISGTDPNGVRFEGTDGWIFVTRTPSNVTGSDPAAGTLPKEPLEASDPAILAAELGPGAIRLYESEEQHTNWIRSIQAGTTKTAVPPEVAHRSTSACLLAHIAMKLPRRLYWDAEHERFRDDPEANSMLSRPRRAGFDITHHELRP